MKNKNENWIKNSICHASINPYNLCIETQNTIMVVNSYIQKMGVWDADLEIYSKLIVYFDLFIIANAE